MPTNFFHLKLSQFQSANGTEANAKIDGMRVEKTFTSIKLMAVRLLLANRFSSRRKSSSEILNRHFCFWRLRIVQ